MKLAIVGSHSQVEETEENLKKVECIVSYIVPLDNVDEIVSGGAKGIDTIAEMLAKKHKKPLTVYPAEWKKYGTFAGPIRNRLIVNRCDQVIAFPDYNSVGTHDSIKMATKQNKLRAVIYWEEIEDWLKDNLIKNFSKG